MLLRTIEHNIGTDYQHHKNYKSSQNIRNEYEQLRTAALARMGGMWSSSLTENAIN